MLSNAEREGKANEVNDLLRHVLYQYENKKLPYEQSTLDFLNILKRYLESVTEGDVQDEQIKLNHLAGKIFSKIEEDLNGRRVLKTRNEKIQIAAIIDMLILRGGDSVAARKALGDMKASCPRTYGDIDESFCIVDQPKNGNRVHSMDVKKQVKRFRPYIEIKPKDFFSVLSLNHKKFISDDKNTMNAWNNLIAEMHATPQDELIIELPNDVQLTDEAYEGFEKS